MLIMVKCKIVVTLLPAETAIWELGESRNKQMIQELGAL